MPKNTTNEFKNLIDAYDITSANALDLRNPPLYFVQSGAVGNGKFSVLGGKGGRYWSSTVSGNTQAYHLMFGNKPLNPAFPYNYRYNGFSVRCLAE